MTSPQHIINALNDSVSNIRTFVIKSIIEDMRKREIIYFGNVQDMILQNDAWLMPDNMQQKPIRLSEIQDVTILIQIFTDLCQYNQKSNSSTKLYGFGNIAIN